MKITRCQLLIRPPYKAKTLETATQLNLAPRYVFMLVSQQRGFCQSRAQVLGNVYTGGALQLFPLYAYECLLPTHNIVSSFRVLCLT